MSKVNCCCCGKQIISREAPRFDKYVTKRKGSVLLWPGKWCCGYCSEDLDEWGLFPEERCFAPELYN